MTEQQGKPVSPRLRTMMLRFLKDPSDDFTARRLSDETDIPLGTVGSLVDRCSAYGWVDSWLERGSRLYQINTDAVTEICDALDVPVPANPPTHRTRRVAAASEVPDYRPPRTLAQLVAEEPRAVVESLCRRLGWDSPYEQDPARAPQTQT